MCANRSQIRGGGLGVNSFLFDCHSGFLSSESINFFVQSQNNGGQMCYPRGRPLAVREVHFNGVLVPKQTFGQRVVESFNDGLIAVDIHMPASDLDIVFFEQLIHRTHELMAGIHLKQFRPRQRSLGINPFQSSCDFSCPFCGQQFGGLLSRGDVNQGEGVLEGFRGAGWAVVRELQKIGLVNSVENRNIKFRFRNALWRRQVNLPMSLPRQPVLCGIFRDFHR